MNLWFQSSVLGIHNVWPYKYLLPFFFSPRVLLFGDIITPKLLVCDLWTECKHS